MLSKFVEILNMYLRELARTSTYFSLYVVEMYLRVIFSIIKKNYLRKSIKLKNFKYLKASEKDLIKRAK